MDYHKVDGPYEYAGIISVTQNYALWKAKHSKLGSFVTIKEVHKNNSSKKNSQLERKIYSICNHPNIARLYQTFEDTNNYYFIQEYLSHGSLQQYIHQQGKLDEEECKYLFSQIINSIQYLHKQIGVFHGDISADMFGFSGSYNNLKITDLQFANFISSNNSIEKFPIPHYMAPEEIKGISKPIQTDVWHCGVLLYYMLTGTFPFDDEDEASLLSLILHMKPIIPGNISPQLKDLLMRMLIKEPDDRITIDEIIVHPWFLKIPVVMSSDKVSIKNEIIKALESQGYSKTDVIHDLKQKLLTENTAAYYLALQDFDDSELSSYSSSSDSILPQNGITFMPLVKSKTEQFDHPFKTRGCIPGSTMSLVPSHSRRRTSIHIF